MSRSMLLDSLILHLLGGNRFILPVFPHIRMSRVSEEPEASGAAEETVIIARDAAAILSPPSPSGTLFNLPQDLSRLRCGSPLPL